MVQVVQWWLNPVKKNEHLNEAEHELFNNLNSWRKIHCERKEREGKKPQNKQTEENRDIFVFQ